MEKELKRESSTQPGVVTEETVLQRVEHDEVFGEITEGGPDYRSVSQNIRQERLLWEFCLTRRDV